MFNDLLTQSNQKKKSFAAASPISGQLSVVFEPFRNHTAIFTRGADGFLHYFYIGPTGAWCHDSQSFYQGGKVAIDGDIYAVFETRFPLCFLFVFFEQFLIFSKIERNHSAVIYKGFLIRNFTLLFLDNFLTIF